MSDSDSLGIDKIELRGGTGTKPNDFNHLEPCKGKCTVLGVFLVVFGRYCEPQMCDSRPLVVGEIDK